MIDHDLLEEMGRAIGRRGVGNIADELERQVRRLAEELPGLDHHERGRRAHTFKGATAYLGTVTLNQLAREADRAFKAGEDPGPALTSLVTAVDEEMTELRAAIDELPDEDQGGPARDPKA